MNTEEKEKLDKLREKYKFTDEFLRAVINNTIIAGETVITVYDWEETGPGSKKGTLGKFQIVNTFKGCNCGESHDES